MKTSIGITSALLIAFLAPAVRGDDYAKDNGWWFKNFKDATLSWEIYRDTFIGIPPTKDAVASLFDTLFFTQVCNKELAKTGNCYGLSLLSVLIRKNGGHMGYCMPIPQYSGDILGSCAGLDAAGPTDPMLRRAINVMHGHQVNLPTLELFLDVFAKHQNRDANYAYETFVAVQMQEGPALVSLTKDMLPGKSAHTMVAYRAEDLGAGGRRIYVYDPFRTWADPALRSWYQTEQNFIQINGTSWSFQMRGWSCTTSTWSGDPASGGNIVIIPASVTGPHSRSPASLGDTIIGKIVNTLFLSGGSSEIEQITDGQGKRLFTPGTNEVDTDPATGMMNMVPWIPSGQGGAETTSDTVLFQLGSSHGALTVRVKGSESGYTLRSLGAGNYVSVTARGGRGTDTITLQHPGASAARISLENGRGTDEYDIEFAQATRPRERVHVLRAKRMRIPEGATVEMASTGRDQALLVSSPAADLQYDMELKDVSRDGAKSLNKNRVVQAAGTLQKVQPTNWSDLAKSEVVQLIEPR